MVVPENTPKIEPTPQVWLAPKPDLSIHHPTPPAPFSLSPQAHPNPPAFSLKNNLFLEKIVLSVFTLMCT